MKALIPSFTAWMFCHGGRERRFIRKSEKDLDSKAVYKRIIHRSDDEIQRFQTFKESK